MNINVNANTIANAVGTDAQNTLLLSEYVVKTNSPLDLAEPLDWVRSDTWMPQNALTLATKQAGIITWDLPSGFRKYLESIGAIPSNANIVEIGLPKSRTYPDASIARKIRDDKILSKKTIIPYFTTPDIPNAILTAKQSLDFNSKDFIRNNSGTDWQMAPGEIASNFDEIADKLSVLGRECPQAKNVYAKFATSAGGGVGKFDINNANAIKNYMINFAGSCLGYDAPPNMSRPVVLELDVSELPGVKKIYASCGVTYLSGKESVQYIGATKQIIENAAWAGGEVISGQDCDYEELLKSTSLPVVKKYQSLGYLGWISVGVIVVQKTDGNLDAFVCEANCRLTGSTSLFGLRGSGVIDKNKRARIMTFKIKGDDPLGTLGRGGLLFRGNEGVIPTLIDTYPNKPYDENLTKVRAVIVADNYKKLDNLVNKMKQR